jgi:hypothetical protein
MAFPPAFAVAHRAEENARIDISNTWDTRASTKR